MFGQAAVTSAFKKAKSCCVDLLAKGYSKACSYSCIILRLSRCSKPWKRMRPCISSKKFGDRTTPCVWILTRVHLVGKKQMKAKFCCKQKTAMWSSLLLSSWIPRRTSLRHSAPLKKKQLFLQFIYANSSKPSKKTYSYLSWTYLNLFELIYKYRISNL